MTIEFMLVGALLDRFSIGGWWWCYKRVLDHEISSLFFFFKCLMRYRRLKHWGLDMYTCYLDKFSIVTTVFNLHSFLYLFYLLASFIQRLLYLSFTGKALHHNGDMPYFWWNLQGTSGWHVCFRLFLYLWLDYPPNSIILISQPLLY